MWLAAARYSPTSSSVFFSLLLGGISAFLLCLWNVKLKGWNREQGDSCMHVFWLKTTATTPTQRHPEASLHYQIYQKTYKTDLRSGRPRLNPSVQQLYFISIALHSAHVRKVASACLPCLQYTYDYIVSCDVMPLSFSSPWGTCPSTQEEPAGGVRKPKLRLTGALSRQWQRHTQHHTTHLSLSLSRSLSLSLSGVTARSRPMRTPQRNQPTCIHLNYDAVDMALHSRRVRLGNVRQEPCGLAMTLMKSAGLPACLIGGCCSCFCSWFVLVSVLGLYLFLCSLAARFCFVWIKVTPHTPTPLTRTPTPSPTPTPTPIPLLLPPFFPKYYLVVPVANDIAYSIIVVYSYSSQDATVLID